MKIKYIILFLTCLLLLSSFTAPATACCEPPAPPCHHCEDTVWVNDCDSADCESCVDGSCQVCGGDPDLICCNGTCCEACCDSITCYNPSTETCCSDGYGTVCSGSSPCCVDVPGLASICTNYCYDDVCCSAGQWCCDNGCCDYPCCGAEGCCGANKYCCGDPAWNELCCNADEVCCWDFDGMGGIEYYCNPPCWDEVTDSTSCSEDQEETYKCMGCVLFPSGDGCANYTYRDYSGLEIKTCHDGCGYDWNTENKVCYQERLCVDKKVHDDALCMVFGNGEVGCVSEYPDDTPILACVECGTGGDVIYTYKRQTCSCY